MKKLLFITAVIGTLFSGCAVTSVNYNSEVEKDKKNKQYIEHTECRYLVGPFNTSDNILLEEAIANTIKEGNEQGMYGNKLINVDIQEGGFTGIFVTELCLYVKGNIIYTKDL